MTPAKGLRFYHARVLDGENRPQMFQVTRIAKGEVSYRPVYGTERMEYLGCRQYCPVEEFPKWVKCLA